MADEPLITGELRRTVDDRFRITLPQAMASAVSDEAGETILAKERYGSLSLWNPEVWRERIETSTELLRQKIRAGRLEGRLADVQRLGRLLSTRFRTVRLANRSRLLIPEGFREFLDVGPNQEVMLVGAAICVEIWHPRAWQETLREQMPEFGTLLHELTD